MAGDTSLTQKTVLLLQVFKKKNNIIWINFTVEGSYILLRFSVCKKQNKTQILSNKIQPSPCTNKLFFLGFFLSSTTHTALFL